MEKLNLNKNLQMNKDFKERIESLDPIEGKKYLYYDYDFQLIEKIAKMNPISDDLSYFEEATLVQVLFPEYIIGANESNDFVIIDPNESGSPKYCYTYIGSYLNNDYSKKYNLLIEEIIDLFKVNNIDYNKKWDKLFDKITHKKTSHMKVKDFLEVINEDFNKLAIHKDNVELNSAIPYMIFDDWANRLMVSENEDEILNMEIIDISPRSDEFVITVKTKEHQK